MLIDARSATPGAEFVCDLCIIGAGPAGIAIVDRLRDSGLSIVLVESGGFEPDIATQQLFRGENHGHPYYDLDACRMRLFGGSTNRWGGWCRPFDPVDFQRDEWVAWSGWPISETALKPFYDDTAALFGLPKSGFDLATWKDHLPAPFPLQGTNFENVVFQYSPVNFGAVYRERVLDARNVTTLIYANLTGMELARDSSRIELVRVATLTGRSHTVRPRVVVLATGGIENARLLLAAKHDRETGLGNEFDMVGRFFMEHLHVGTGHMSATQQASDRGFYRREEFGGVHVGGVIIPTARALASHRLLTTSIAVEAASYSTGPQRMNRPTPLSYKALRLYTRANSGNLKPVAETLKSAFRHAANVPRRYRTWKKSQGARARSERANGTGRLYSLYFRTAQAPDPESRVTLSGNRDALGLPRIKLTWKVNAFDTASVIGWLNILDRDLRSRGLGHVVMPAEGWESEIIGGPHHMGTTRMSADPRHGVVDEHCRVHSVENLYVAGSSVFATGGYANPTFTLMTLALRLADTLRNRLRREASTSANGSRAVAQRD